jgi:uncharacterized protein (DUF2336 family)
MLNLKPEPVSDAEERVLRTRQTLLRRLADVVCLPSSRVNSFERAVVGDLMVEILREAAVDERRRVAERLSHLSEIPNALLRLLLRDDIEVSGVLVLDCAALSDSDLMACATKGGPEHRLMMAGRRGLSEVVCDVLVDLAEPEALLAVLRNTSASLSQGAIEKAVAKSQKDPSLITPLLRRIEMRPSSAYALYWWANAEQRMAILQRFAVSRQVLQDSVEDVFAMAAQGGWSDPLVRTALQFIERRQRNRAAINTSPYDSLESAVEAIAQGLDKALLTEIANLSGIRPKTAYKIFSDPLGDPLAILCKAAGLSRRHLHCLWKGMRRAEVTLDGELDPTWERAQICYEMLAVDRAQTVLRYWNWAVSSALTPTLLRVMREGEKRVRDEYSPPQPADQSGLAQNYDQ